MGALFPAHHALTKEPQPIADQWMGKCTCGWRTTVSFYEIPSRYELLREIDERHARHVGGSVGGSTSGFR